MRPSSTLEKGFLPTGGAWYLRPDVGELAGKWPKNSTTPETRSDINTAANNGFLKYTLLGYPKGFPTASRARDSAIENSQNRTPKAILNCAPAACAELLGGIKTLVQDAPSFYNTCAFVVRHGSRVYNANVRTLERVALRYGKRTVLKFPYVRRQLIKMVRANGRLANGNHLNHDVVAAARREHPRLNEHTAAFTLIYHLAKWRAVQMGNRGNRSNFPLSTSHLDEMLKSLGFLGEESKALAKLLRCNGGVKKRRRY